MASFQIYYLHREFASFHFEPAAIPLQPEQIQKTEFTAQKAVETYHNDHKDPGTNKILPVWRCALPQPLDQVA